VIEPKSLNYNEIIPSQFFTRVHLYPIDSRNYSIDLYPSLQMVYMKQPIIQYLHLLLSHNVIGEVQFTNRYNGFIGELDFSEWFYLDRRWEKMYDGGFFLPTVAGSHALDKPVYFTVSEEPPEAYHEIYRRMARLNCEALFFIQWDSTIPFSEWNTSHADGIREQLPVPRMLFYRYDPAGDVFVPSTLPALSGR